MTQSNMLHHSSKPSGSPGSLFSCLAVQASLPERLVRRRLRHLAAKAEPFHNSRLRVWSAAVVPQLPLIPLPLPNITIYYTVWRIISNRSASRGEKAPCSICRRVLQLAQHTACRHVSIQGTPLKLMAHTTAEACHLWATGISKRSTTSIVRHAAGCQLSLSHNIHAQPTSLQVRMTCLLP